MILNDEINVSQKQNEKGKHTNVHGFMFGKKGKLKIKIYIKAIS